MKRKALIFVLTLVLLVSMFPVTAHAATTMKPTSSCIDLIKKFEGFVSKPYWDYKQWSVGYGTRCPDDKLDYYKKYGITKAEAQKLLEEHLKDYVDSVNKFAKKYDLNFTQPQFDALVSFTYNVGGGWTNGASTQLFTKAVLNGATGNEFLAVFGLWSNADGQTNKILVERRLLEANLFLNGVYSNVIPSNYNYVLFNHSTSKFMGATRTIRVLCYDSKLGAPEMPQGTKSGYRFLGWYTKSSGGEWVDKLNDSHDGKKLYAHWQKDEGDTDSSGNILGTAASYTRAAHSALKIYAQPRTSAKTTGSIKKGAVMNIVADYITADNVKWGLLKQGGWVCLTGTKTENEPENETVAPPVQDVDRVVATGTVVSSVGSLCIRAEATTSSDVMGYVKGGQHVEFYELKYVGSTHWGRIDKGWISLKYVNLDDQIQTKPEETKPEETQPEETKPADKVVAKGMVSLSSGSLNVRAKADASSALKGTLKNGDIVEFYEMTTVGSYQWGRMAMGWVRMDYVKLARTETLPIDSISARSGAGTDYSKVGSYKKGDEVNIYETAVVGSSVWGYTDKGWINLTYATLADKQEENKPAETVIATGKVTSDYLTIRAGIGSSYDKVGTYKKGDTVKIYETGKSGSYTWGRTDKGWISLSNVELDGEEEETKPAETVIATGKVTSDSLNIRKGAGTSYDVIGTYKKGTAVKIYETKKVGSSTWGRTDKGWIGLSGVRLDGGEEKTKPEEPVIATGKVTSDSLNICKGAGTSYDVIGTYKKGTSVKIYETKKVGSSTWGRTDKGWIGLSGVQLDGEKEETNSAATRTGTVSASGTLNVRKGAGASYSKVGTVKKGDKLTITDLKLADGSAWGKISTGWVCLDHVKMDKPTAGAPALTMGSDLNIRKGAGTSYSVVGKYDKGVVITVLQTKTVSGVSWARTDKGWVSMDYVL